MEEEVVQFRCELSEITWRGNQSPHERSIVHVTGSMPFNGENFAQIEKMRYGCDIEFVDRSGLGDVPLIGTPLIYFHAWADVSSATQILLHAPPPGMTYTMDRDNLIRFHGEILLR